MCCLDCNSEKSWEAESLRLSFFFFFAGVGGDTRAQNVFCISDRRHSFNNEKLKQCKYQGTREFNILNL